MSPHELFDLSSTAAHSSEHSALFDIPEQRSEVSSPEIQAENAKIADYDTRIAAAEDEIKRVLHDLNAISSPTEAAPEGVVANIGYYLAGVAHGIGAFFKAICGHPDPDLSEQNVHITHLAQRLDTDTDKLKELQSVRHQCQQMLQQMTAHAEVVHAGKETDMAQQSKLLMETLLHKTQEARGAPVGAAEIPPAAVSVRAVAMHPEHPVNLQPPETPTPHDQQPEASAAHDLPRETPASQDQEWEKYAPHQLPADAPVPRGQPHEVTPLDTKPFEAPANEVEKNHVVGEPAEADQYVRSQSEKDYHIGGASSIVTQEMILNKFAHDPNAYTQIGLAGEAQAGQTFEPPEGGVLGRLGDLIQKHGYQVDHVAASSLDELAERLARGEEAIVGVNAGMLGLAWAEDPKARGDESANHVVWITGARVTDHNGVREVSSVFVVDSGVGKTYELDAQTFTHAWEASGRYAVYAAQSQP